MIPGLAERDMPQAVHIQDETFSVRQCCRMSCNRCSRSSIGKHWRAFHTQPHPPTHFSGFYGLFVRILLSSPTMFLQSSGHSSFLLVSQQLEAYIGAPQLPELLPIVKHHLHNVCEAISIYQLPPEFTCQLLSSKALPCREGPEAGSDIAAWCYFLHEQFYR
jgi:hypothetical protein